jgi:DNA-binding transcriptional ArsR family regulator
VTSAAKIFRALADPTRRQVLEELKNGQLAAGEIASRFDISGPSISRHLSLLEAADLISVRREGNRLLYQLQPESLVTALNGFLSAVCPTQIVQRKKQAQRKKRKA